MSHLKVELLTALPLYLSSQPGGIDTKDACTFEKVFLLWLCVNMAQQEGDEKSNDERAMHQIPDKLMNPVEIHRFHSPKDIGAKTNEWVMVPGLQQGIEIKDDEANVVIHAHSHMHCATKSARADLGIFVNGNQCGIKGGWHGTALSHTDSWVPAVSIASTVLKRGHHIFHIAVRNWANNGQEARTHSTAMMVQVFKRIPVMQWRDINLNDKQLFNPQLEYRIELKGEDVVYPVRVSKTKLFFIDESLSALSHVGHDTKRSVNGQYIVTKIQAK